MTAIDWLHAGECLILQHDAMESLNQRGCSTIELYYCYMTPANVKDKQTRLVLGDVSAGDVKQLQREIHAG